jgi:1-deoxy-D-xylulose-5-phosphate reductoisomerase
MRKVIVLGSTGSIGTQALEVIRSHPDQLQLVGVSAFRNADLANQQAQAFGLKPSQVAIGVADAVSLIESVQADVILNGITGSVGLAPTISALKTGALLALANKESLIAGGPIVKALAKPGQIVPVDSEHSAIAQALRAGSANEVSKLILTASGGPFRGFTRKQLSEVTPEMALKHPTWSMGKVITTNSASLFNKGLELIEAHLLFDVPFEQIEVTVHPQSVVHSFVEFIDGSVIAQCSPPDMKQQIAFGLSWPQRLSEVSLAVDWTRSHTWNFEPLDEAVFSSVRMAREVGQAGLTYPAVYNAANEQAVEGFHGKAIRFDQIFDIVEEVLAGHKAESEVSLESIGGAEDWAREAADSLIAKRQ